jgi:hypothetical protein
MFWRRDKPLSENDVYKKYLENLENQINELRQEKIRLMSIVSDMYKAMISKEAPVYYNDKRSQEFPMTPEQEKAKAKSDLESKFFNEYIKESEATDLFQSPEDLERYLKQMDADDIISKVSAAAMDPLKSLHGNEES